jgi:cardiolipin hydrolase
MGKGKDKKRGLKGKRRGYVSVYFSPNRGAADQIIGFIDRCENTLDIAVYSLTHDDIAEALMRAHKRGVKIRILMDKTQAGNKYADDEKLEEAGIALRRDTKSGLMHHKFAIGDGDAVANGSFNWTKNADTRNAENFVVLRMKKTIRTFQKEYDRLWVENAPKS